MGASKEATGAPNIVKFRHGDKSSAGINEEGWSEKDDVYRVGANHVWAPLVKLIPIPFLRYSEVTLVGSTEKSSADIKTWCGNWVLDNSEYDFLGENCQKFSYELIMWLTGEE